MACLAQCRIYTILSKNRGAANTVLDNLKNRYWSYSLNGLQCRPVTARGAGSNPVGTAKYKQIKLKVI